MGSTRFLGFDANAKGVGTELLRHALAHAHEQGAWSDAARLASIEARKHIGQAIELPLRAEHQVNKLLKARTNAILSFVSRHVPAHGPSGLFGHIAAEVGGVSMIGIKGGAKLYMAPWIAGQKAVESVALAKGLSPIEASHVRDLCACYDVLNCKAVFLGLKHVGLRGPAAASLFVPTASCAYLAHATATDPRAVIKAASGAVKGAMAKIAKAHAKFASKFGSLVFHSAIESPTVENAVSMLADAIKLHQGDDWYFALLTQAIGKSKNVKDAIRVANLAYVKYPKPVEAYAV